MAIILCGTAKDQTIFAIILCMTEDALSVSKHRFCKWPSIFNMKNDSWVQWNICTMSYCLLFIMHKYVTNHNSFQILYTFYTVQDNC